MAPLFRSIVLACCVASALSALANVPDSELYALVDPKCLISGSNVLTFCSEETERVREFFGVEIGSDEFKAIDISEDVFQQLNEFLGDVSPE
ncbi:hypothetical protein BSKO_11261 [Bryopsis sp. KO-2023]|nr:hypothetical protein BSKO_11261 [Bryopsis sp. KO-2023]